MTTRILLPTLAALAAPLQAQSWAEQNAGELNTTVEATIGTGPLTSITGTIDATESADLFLINVDDVAGFSASSVGTGFDTQMFLFDINGNGISFKDDNTGILQSTLTGQFLTGPGQVIVGISRFDIDPQDSNGDQLWLDQPYDVERQPDDVGAANEFTQWSATNGASSSYTLTLTGASFAAAPSAPDVAWAYIDASASQTTWTTLGFVQHTSTGELVTAERRGLGQYTVYLPRSLSLNGALQVSAFDGHTAVIQNWTIANNKVACNVNVFDVNGALNDFVFYLNYRVGGQDDERAMYLWANQESNPNQYTPSTFNNYNANRGLSTIQRNGVGDYTITVPGLASSQGNVQVSAYSGSGSTAFTRASVASWVPSGADLNINIRTHDGSGNPTDSKFVVSYVESAGMSPAHLGSGAHVWAYDTAAATYDPVGGYVDISDPNAGTMTINRTGTGLYEVIIPGITSLDSQTALVTGYGGNNWATFEFVQANANGTRLEVAVRDFSGNLVDGRFSMFYNNDTPTGTPGTNTVIGTGCGGLVLTPDTRPVTGSDWDLTLTDLPATAAIGLVSLGFTNPNIPLDFLGATGCWAYQDQGSLNTVFLPAPSPSYSLSIPNSASLIGSPIFAQGGAFASGINPLNLITSNGIEATIGDV